MAQLGIIPGLCDSKTHSLPIKPCRSLTERKSTGCGLQRAITAHSVDSILQVGTLFESQNNQAKLVYYDPIFQKEKLRLNEEK